VSSSSDWQPYVLAHASAHTQKFHFAGGVQTERRAVSACFPETGLHFESQVAPVPQKAAQRSHCHAGTLDSIAQLKEGLRLVLQEARRLGGGHV